MENPRKTLSCQFLLCFFFVLCKITDTASSSPSHDSFLSNRAPTSSPPPFHVHPSSTHSNLMRVLLGALFGCLTGAFASIFFLFFIRLFLLFANSTPILKGPVIFYPKISPKSLKVIFPGNTASQQQLGSSPNGKYFKIPLTSELTVAVKLLETNFSGGSPRLHSNSWKRKVQRELELLAKVSHRNVMSLRAYIRDHEHFSLVYDFIPNGSLDDALKMVRANQLKLSWESRHRIAVGMVKGLKYLHFEFIPRILHYNLKPTNVLLDEEFEPKLADCGLARPLADLDASLSSFYLAPECLQSCRYTDKSDVYSFGMILSMLLTGREPGDNFFAEEAGRGGLGSWLRLMQQAGAAREALDEGLLGEGEEEEEMLMAVRIALVCLSDLPADRPSSDELEAMLTQLHNF